MRRAEQPGGVGLTPGDDPLGLVQLVRALDLGDVAGFDPQKILTLVPGHMQAGDPRLGISGCKIHNGRIHPRYSQASPSAQALQEPPISIGTSMPCLASS